MKCGMRLHHLHAQLVEMIIEKHQIIHSYVTEAIDLLRAICVGYNRNN